MPEEKIRQLFESVSLRLFVITEDLRASRNDLEDEFLCNLADNLIEKLNEADAMIYEATGWCEKL